MAKVTINETVCKGCGLCAQACPKKIIAPNQGRLNTKGYHPAQLTQMELCIGCAMCAIICPDCAIMVER